MNHTPDNRYEVDHINGDSLDNRKENLRIIRRIDNIHNVCVRSDNNTTKIRGISYDKRNEKYKVDFHYNGRRYYFKDFKKLEYAVYLRFLCDQYFLDKFRSKSGDETILLEISKLSNDMKQEIESYFYNKI